MSTIKRAWIFANGIIEEPSTIGKWIEPGDLLIAADGGSRHLSGLGKIPNLLVGDLDSISPVLLDLYSHQSVRIIRYPTEKNETDLELAVQAAIQEGCQSIRILGALGGRIDHTLGNLAAMSAPNLKDVDLRLVDIRQEIMMIWKELEISGQPGDILSLLPMNGIAEGVWTEGLKYPLNHETLYPFQARGVSNVFVNEQARVGLSNGLLLCIHLRG